MCVLVNEVCLYACKLCFVCEVCAHKPTCTYCVVQVAFGDNYVAVVLLMRDFVLKKKYPHFRGCYIVFNGVGT